MEDENGRFQSMVVKSPEKLKTDLNQFSAKKEEFLKTVRDLKTQVEAKKKLTNDHMKEQENQEIRREMLKELIQINKLLR